MVQHTLQTGSIQGGELFDLPLKLTLPTHLRFTLSLFGENALDSRPNFRQIEASSKRLTAFHFTSGGVKW